MNTYQIRLLDHLKKEGSGVLVESLIDLYNLAQSVDPDIADIYHGLPVEQQLEVIQAFTVWALNERNENPVQTIVKT